MNGDIELLVLAGGFGTRLRSAVPEVPKPLAPVADQPFLFYLVESWLAQGVTKLIFLLHHKAKNIEDFLQELKARGLLKHCEVQTLTEPEPLGTGGRPASHDGERAGRIPGVTGLKRVPLASCQC